MTRAPRDRHKGTRLPTRGAAEGARSVWYRSVERTPDETFPLVVWRLYRIAVDGQVRERKVAVPLIEMTPGYGGRRRAAAMLRDARRALKGI